MSTQVEEAKQAMQMQLEESGIRSEDINLDYITEDSYQELIADAPHISEVVNSDEYKVLIADAPRVSDDDPSSVNTVLNGFNLMWETDRLVFNYYCGLPNRAYVLRTQLVSYQLNGSNCRGSAEYTIVSRS